jgi:hypothetical protein
MTGDWQPASMRRCITLRVDGLKETENEATTNCQRMFKNIDVKATFEVGTPDQVAAALDADERAQHPVFPVGDKEGNLARIMVILRAHNAERAAKEAKEKESLELAKKKARDQMIEALIKAEKIREELGLPKVHYETQKYTRDDEYGRPVPEVTIGNRYGKNPDEYAKSKEEIEVMEEQKKTAEHVKTSDEIQAAFNDPQPLRRETEKANKEAQERKSKEALFGEKVKT